MSSIVSRAPDIHRALFALNKIASLPENANVRITNRLTPRPVRTSLHKCLATVFCQCFCSYKKYEKATNINEVYTTLTDTLSLLATSPDFNKYKATCEKVIRIYNHSLTTYRELKDLRPNPYELNLNMILETQRLAQLPRPTAEYPRTDTGQIDYDKLFRPETSPQGSPTRSIEIMSHR